MPMTCLARPSGLPVCGDVAIKIVGAHTQRATNAMDRNFSRLNQASYGSHGDAEIIRDLINGQQFKAHFSLLLGLSTEDVGVSRNVTVRG